MFPDKVLVRMQATRCTGFAGVPTHYQMLLRNSHLKQMKFPDLRYVQQAGGRLSGSLIQELRETLPNTRVFVMYGQTEATARLSYLSPELLDTKLASIGKAIPGVTLRVLDEAGKQVAPGQVGEIVAEGDNICLGYWRDIEETSTVFRGARLHTGDLATVDEDGYLFIVDRVKDILKCGGKRVGCKQVEDALLESDTLVEAAVVGIPDNTLGEAVKAFVVPRDGQDGDVLESLQKFCADHLPPHLVPKEIVVLDALPKNSAGKVMKVALKMMQVAGK
jgi:acyl-coenzyme A synthetase/AMP-(fatty) acid ligase